MKIINVFVVIILLSNVLFSQVKKTNHISVIADAKILFQENFEDTDFASRGWYDALRGNITSAEHIEGSGHSLECKFLKGERGPEGGTPGRHLFEETDEVYLSFYVKYSANYTGSNKPYHPHEFHFITNENSKWVGPAYTHLTTYIEQNEGEPLLAIQDGQNVDEDNIGVDLTNITENRAVAGCNGDGDGYGEGDCYLNGGVHWNGKQWRSGNKYFGDNTGKYYKNDWHFIEVYFKLNSIVDGKAIPDGVVKYWYDGEALIDHEDVMLRTGQFPNMKFNQFLIAPYIGDGSPIEQTMWIDDLTVATSRVNTQTKDLKEIANPVSYAYPNPFSESTNIKFEITEPSFVNLTIYDILGNEISKLVDEYKPTGIYNIGFDSKKIKSGIYYYVLQVDSEITIGKVVCVK